MNTASKAGFAILVLFFGLPFAGMGMALMFKLLTAPPGTPSNVAGAIFASGFALIGVLIIVGAVYGWSRLKQIAALKEQNPGSPWLWREDWAQSRSNGAQRNRAAWLWIATVLVSCLTLPMLATVNSPRNQKNPPPIFVFLILGSFAPITAISALMATIRRERFGKTWFEFDSLPISPGKKLTGRVELRLAGGAQHGIDARLCSIRRIITGSGKQQSTHEQVLWEEQQNVAANMLGFGPLGASVPISFNIPAEAYESDDDNPRDKVLWLLRVKADIPGVDFAEEYELPVFRTDPAARQAATSPSNAPFATTFGSGAAAAPAMQAESEPVAQPAKTSAVISTDENGTQIYFPPFRNPQQAMMLLVFTAVWSGVVYFLLHSKAPLLFAIVFAAVDALLVCGVLSVFFSSIRITLSSDTLTLCKLFLGIPRTNTIPFSEIAQIHPVSGMQQGTSASYSLRLTTKSGQPITLVNSITDRQEARWLASQVESAAGLKPDTRVELNDFYGPPPQRGATPAASRFNASKQSGWVAAAIFVAWLCFVFARFLPSFSTHPTIPSSRIKSPARSQAAQVLPRTFALMTDADESRISLLAAQDQAEELLERSIQHDERAREMLEKHFADYKSVVTETARMKQLLNRAQYSRDLRVRYAYCDMTLAMDGWNEDAEAVQILLDRAKSDPKSRAYDVWFLGMLGGRGIEAEKVHDALLDYAHNDTDAQVRQWATEGLRFLGTDQALDDLFNIFVSDSSLSVRDRAGCNVSDCGNFSRKQRMRMFPKFLELAESSSTDAQTRNWSFLALAEISDVRLPSDAKAWRSWYAEHGQEKLAEFEAIPEWQVRGDE